MLWHFTVVRKKLFGNISGKGYISLDSASVVVWLQ